MAQDWKFDDILEMMTSSEYHSSVGQQNNPSEFSEFDFDDDSMSPDTDQSLTAMAPSNVAASTSQQQQQQHLTISSRMFRLFACRCNLLCVNADIFSSVI